MAYSRDALQENRKRQEKDQRKTRERLERDKRETREKLHTKERLKKYGAMGDGLTYRNNLVRERENQRDQELKRGTLE